MLKSMEAVVHHVGAVKHLLMCCLICYKIQERKVKIKFFQNCGCKIREKEIKGEQTKKSEISLSQFSSSKCIKT